MLALLGPVAAASASPPIGYLDALVQDSGGIRVVGWSIDPDTAAAIEVHVYVDGSFAGATTALSYRPDVGAAFPGYGDYHGYDLVVPSPGAGGHEVCAYGINVGAPSINPQLGCDFGPAYSTQITVFDFAGNVTQPTAVDLTGMVSGVPFALETATATNGTASFSSAGSVPGGVISLLVREPGNPAFPGPLFRSGMLAALPVGAPANPAGGIDIIVPPAIPLSTASLSALAASAVPPSMTVSTIFGPVTMLVPAPPLVITGSGTLTLVLPAVVVLPPALGGTSVALSYSITLGATPAMSANLGQIVVLAATGPATMTIPGFEFLGPWVEPMITPMIVTALDASVNGAILAQVPAALCLPSLPSGTSVSARRIVITKSGLALSMAIGSFGAVPRCQ